MMKMMKMKFILTAALAVSVGLTACKKRGDFTTDKQEYFQGDVITVTNTTVKESEFYKWDFGGVEVIDENPIYTLPENTPVGSFTINVLPVNSLNTTGNWKEYSRTVNVLAAEEAKIIFFLPEPVLSGANETCTITYTDEDGISTSKTIDVVSGTPSCGSNNNLDAATFDNLPAGKYYFDIEGSASNGNYGFSSYSVELEDGFDCRLIDISKI